MAKQKVPGPYQVINRSSPKNPLYEIVEMTEVGAASLRPRYLTRNRQAAQGKKLRLNKKWQGQKVNVK
jgi:hypothetical protein